MENVANTLASLFYSLDLNFKISGFVGCIVNVLIQFVADFFEKIQLETINQITVLINIFKYTLKAFLVLRKDRDLINFKNNILKKILIEVVDRESFLLNQVLIKAIDDIINSHK